MIDTPTSGTRAEAAQTRLHDTRCFGTRTARVSFPGQVNAVKVDFWGVSGLGRNVGSGTWPKLSLSTRTRAGCAAGRLLELAALDRIVYEEDMLA
jgi:hypothetical protein